MIEHVVTFFKILGLVLSVGLALLGLIGWLLAFKRDKRKRKPKEVKRWPS